MVREVEGMENGKRKRGMEGDGGGGGGYRKMETLKW